MFNASFQKQVKAWNNVVEQNINKTMVEIYEQARNDLANLTSIISDLTALIDEYYQDLQDIKDRTSYVDKTSPRKVVLNGNPTNSEFMDCTVVENFRECSFDFNYYNCPGELVVQVEQGCEYVERKVYEFTGMFASTGTSFNPMLNDTSDSQTTLPLMKKTMFVTRNLDDSYRILKDVSLDIVDKGSNSAATYPIYYKGIIKISKSVLSLLVVFFPDDPLDKNCLYEPSSLQEGNYN